LLQKRPGNNADPIQQIGRNSQGKTRLLGKMEEVREVESSELPFRNCSWEQQ